MGADGGGRRSGVRWEEQAPGEASDVSLGWGTLGNRPPQNRRQRRPIVDCRGLGNAGWPPPVADGGRGPSLEAVTLRTPG
jgi:hypothetical protein